jgi:hypothetical protein
MLNEDKRAAYKPRKTLKSVFSYVIILFFVTVVPTTVAAEPVTEKAPASGSLFPWFFFPHATEPEEFLPRRRPTARRTPRHQRPAAVTHRRERPARARKLAFQTYHFGGGTPAEVRAAIPGG